MMTRFSGSQRAVGGPLCIAALATLVACGGSTPEPETPGAQVDVSASGDGGGGAAVDSEAVEGSGMSPEAQEAYRAGMAAYAGADLDGARTQFERAIEADPRAPEPLVALGMVRERRGEKAAALEAYQKAIQVRSGFGPAVTARVGLLIKMGRAAEAEDMARQQLAKHPDSAAVLSALAEVRSARGDSTSAQELAQKALKQDPDYRPAMVTLARDHYRARRLDLSLYTLQAILDGYGKENPPRDKNNVEARFLRALIFKEQGKRKAAIEELTSVVERRPDLVDARLHLAAYMLEAGNANEARPILEKALEYDPSDVLVHLNLGDAYRLMGKPKDALDHLNWVSRKDASLAQVHYNLGLVYLFSPQVPGLNEEQAVDQAIASLEEFKKLQPRSARGEGDDVDELIARAKNKKSIMQAMKEAPSDDGFGEASGEAPSGAAGEGDGFGSDDEGWE